MTVQFDTASVKQVMTTVGQNGKTSGYKYSRCFFSTHINTFWQHCRNTNHRKGGIAIETKHHMHFEMTPEQYRLLSENAKTCGLSKRAYLIRLIQGHHPVARQNDEMKALRREIHAIGNNINQIARSVNARIATRKVVQEAPELLGRVYEKLYEMGRR